MISAACSALVISPLEYTMSEVAWSWAKNVSTARVRWERRAGGLPWGQFPRGGVAGCADQVWRADLGHGGEQQRQPGVVAGHRARPGGQAGKGGGLDGVQPGRRAAVAVIAPGQPRQPL